jgi:hypothetical protein
MTHRRGWLLLVLLATSAGCGGGADELAPVAGQVFYRGQPLTGGTIVFAPDPERGGRGPLALGAIGPDGRYSLRSDARYGAVPGWHRITIAPGDTPTEPPLPGHYSDPEHSGLSREVRAGQPNVIDLHLD